MKFAPTDEQVLAVDLARTGNNLTVEALAGAGKTSTLRLIAEALPGRGNYIAFNRKIVDDAGASFAGSNVRAKTAHQLAWHAIGRRYSHQSMKQRLRGKDVAEILGVDVPWVFDDAETSHEIHLGTIGGLAMGTVQAFCRSGDREIGRRHVPTVLAIDAPGEFHNNRILSDRVFPLARKIWADMIRPHEGHFVMGFNYLKLWQLSDPVIDGDYLLFDEAQDANPVMLSIVQNQDHLQRIYVGDSRQQIYEWNGALNALQQTEGERCWLTRSFRFGPEIADAANQVLARLEHDSVEVIGAGPAGAVGQGDELPDVLLARTNAGVVLEALKLLAKGYRVLVQGGTWEVVRFAQAAERLQRGIPEEDHPDLKGFKNWEQVVDYVEQDALGADLKSLVRLVDEFGPEQIVEGLKRTVRTDREGVPTGPVDVTVSTAHKSKGAEWGHVRLVDDFQEPDDDGEIPDPEIRLLYVAVTRAMRRLDPGMVSLTGRPNLAALRAAMAVKLDSLADPDEVPLDAGQIEIPGVDRRMLPTDRIPGGSDGPRDRQPREMSIDAARDRLGHRVLSEPCGFCDAVAGDPCVIRRGPRAGLALTKAHTPRVDAAARAAGISVVDVRSATA